MVTPESLKVDEIEEETAKLPKRLFWTLGKRMIGSAFRFFSSQTVGWPDLYDILWMRSRGTG